MNKSTLLAKIAESNNVQFAACLEVTATLVLLTTTTKRELTALHSAIVQRASALGLHAPIDGNITNLRLSRAARALRIHVLCELTSDNVSREHALHLVSIETARMWKH